jgi:3-polyprenyl-4-hydroxybenzoate decarboxylase
MAHQYLFTRKDGKEDVLHVGETGTLVGFTGAHGIAAAVAEMKRLAGQAAISQELSASEFEQAKARAEKAQQEFEAAQPKISFDL